MDDNFDIYLIWALISNNRFNWVKIIMDRMMHCKENFNRPLFSTTFVHLILEINGIISKEEDLVKFSIIWDEFGVSKMRY